VKLALRALLLVVAVAVVAQAGVAAYGSTAPVTVPDSVVFWNPHDGLLAADECRRPATVCNHGVVELTTDGGRTYRVVFRAQGTLGMQTLGAEGAIASTAAGKAWRTLDGGRTWRAVSAKTAADWLDPRVGVRFRSYEAHNHGALAMLVTQNGGSTWERRPDPCKGSVTFRGIADLVTPKLWWIACVGEGGAGNEDKAIYRSRDGGRTWEAGAATDLAPRAHGGISSYGYPAALAFSPGGWGLLTESRGTLYVTRDGGMHFHAEPQVARPEIDFAGGAAAFRGGVGYVFLSDNAHPRLLETHDFGRTWRVVRRWGI
jgi:photosystem II stability/assembly factor-like uncharacterized protein